MKKQRFFRSIALCVVMLMLLSSIVRAQERSSLCANFVYSTAKLKTVTFSGPNFIQITSDVGANKLSNSPQWKDDGTKNLTAYISGTKPEVSATFDMCKVGEWVKGVGTDSHEFAPQQLAVDLTYNAMQSSKMFPIDQVNYYSSFEITWYLSTSASGPWKEIGKSSNIMYITHEDPLDRDRVYHTPLHIGCTKAMGEVYPEDIIKKSYTNEFEDRQVALVGKTALLKYWGP